MTRRGFPILPGFVLVLAVVGVGLYVAQEGRRSGPEDCKT